MTEWPFSCYSFQVSRACEPCRRSKTKCDEQRPCARCTQRRTISQCLGKVPLQSVNGFVECTRIERPLQYSGLQVLGDGGHQEGRSTWDMLPTFEAGWSDHALSSLFDQIPSTLRSELLQGLRVFDGIKQAFAQQERLMLSLAHI